MSCFLALPEGFVPGWDSIDGFEQPCVALQVDVGGRVSALAPDPGIGTRIDLSRARLAVGVGDGPLRASIRTSAVRSAGSTGYVGIDGEAWVPEVDVASAGLVGAGFHGDLGIVPDLWVAGADRSWGLAGTAASLGVGQGWMDRSDLGAQGGFARDWFAVDLALTSGEGASLRERNEGKDLAVAVSAAPLTGTETPHGLVVTAYARDGSRGIGYARDSRVGARVAGEVPRLTYGAEVLAAWGVAADAERTPVGASVWATGSPIGPLYGVARLDRWTEAGAAGTQLLAAVGGRWDRDSGSRVAALAGVARTDLGAAPVAGAAAFEAGTTWFLQVDGSLRVESTP